MPYQISHRGPPGPCGPTGQRGQVGPTGPAGAVSFIGSDGSQVPQINVGTLGISTSFTAPYGVVSKLGVGTVPLVTLSVHGVTHHMGDTYVTGGNLGVGTTEPLYTLDVAGDVRVARLVVGRGVALSATGTGEYVASGLLSVQGTQNSTRGHTVGAEGVLSGADNGATTHQGSFFKTVGWDDPGPEHVVTYETLWCNDGNDNVCGQLRFFVSNKSTDVPKAGVVVCDVYKLYGQNTAVVVYSTSRNTDLQTLSVTVLDKNIIVYTDSDCRVCWNLFGAL